MGRAASDIKTIGMLGAGPKALALASKARVLRELEIVDLEVVLIDRIGVAADWRGNAGYTDGDQRLGTRPEKDVGYPYRSSFGLSVDEGMRRFSWHSFQVAYGRYAGWVDRGTQPPLHREWAAYLRWVFEQAAPTLIQAEVTRIVPGEGEVDVELATGDRHRFDALLLTGPGAARAIGGGRWTWAEDAPVLNGHNFWLRLAEFAPLARVAVVGAGETAASVVQALLARAPDLCTDLISRQGTLYSRGESYYENQFYSDPTLWTSLNLSERREFIRRTDRGVFSLRAISRLEQAENVQLVAGEVTQLELHPGGVALWLEGRAEPAVYERVVVATGFDPLALLELLPEASRRPEHLAQLELFIDHHLRIPKLDGESLEGAAPWNIHMPMIAGLAQGPGFPNLSCLGVLSDRVLSAYLP